MLKLEETSLLLTEYIGIKNNELFTTHCTGTRQLQQNTCITFEPSNVLPGSSLLVKLWLKRQSITVNLAHVE